MAGDSHRSGNSKAHSEDGRVVDGAALDFVSGPISLPVPAGAGGRFLSRGLPVPSHWLHFARLLRVAIRLQNSGESVVSVGFELGYSDGFSMSNQMMRLIGFRPSDVRAYLGWEWILEAWLRREADTGGLAPEYTREILSESVPPLSAEEMKARRELTNGRRGRGHVARRRIAG